MALHADATTDVSVTQVPLSTVQRHWLADATARIDQVRGDRAPLDAEE